MLADDSKQLTLRDWSFAYEHGKKLSDKSMRRTAHRYRDEPLEGSGFDIDRSEVT